MGFVHILQKISVMADVTMQSPVASLQGICYNIANNSKAFDCSGGKAMHGTVRTVCRALLAFRMFVQYNIPRQAEMEKQR